MAKIFVQLVVVVLFGVVPASWCETPHSKSPERSTVGGRQDQMGEIRLEQEEKKKDPYKTAQDGALEYFAQFGRSLKKMAQGESVSVAPASEEVLNHLSGVYLFCVANNGICPFMLDAVLEIDVVNSKQSGKADCPNMKRFWTRWLKNGLEERQKYLIRTGSITIFGKFMTQDRPKYLKCADTVREQIENDRATGEFFKQRYASGSTQVEAVAKSEAVLMQVKEKVRNVFEYIGAASSVQSALAPSSDSGTTRDSGSGAEKRIRK